MLNDNELGRINSDGLFGRLPHLVKLELKRNQLTGIEPNAFEGASRIQDLQLGENKIKEISNKMFLGLHQLKTLYVRSMGNTYMYFLRLGNYNLRFLRLFSSFSLFTIFAAIFTTIKFHA